MQLVSARHDFLGLVPGNDAPLTGSNSCINGGLAAPLQHNLTGPWTDSVQAMMLYAAGLREAGHVAASSSPSSNGGRELKEPDYTEAASLLRQAAGVYQHVQEALLGPLQSSLPSQRCVHTCILP